MQGFFSRVKENHRLVLSGQEKTVLQIQCAAQAYYVELLMVSDGLLHLQLHFTLIISNAIF